MSSYFDKAARDAADHFEHIEVIEEEVIKEVNLVTGDINFPDDLRQHIQKAIAVLGVRDRARTGIETEGMKLSRISRRSALIDELHSLFHEVATRKIKAPYKFSDDPVKTLAGRDEYIRSKK